MGWAYKKIMKVDGENVWVTFIKQQIYRKNNCINGIITGMMGSGKSYAMLSLASQIDPDFELQGNFYFNALEMMKDIKKYYNEGTSKKGKLWIYDEAGIDLNNLSYHDSINRGFNAFFQTARHRNYICFCSVPFISFISKGVRTLMNVQWKADGWLKETSQTKVLPRTLEFNPETQIFYKKRILVQQKGSLDFCNLLLMDKPPKRILKEYERLKNEFTSKLMDDVTAKMEQTLNKAKEIELGRGNKLTPLQEKIVQLLVQGKDRITISKTLGFTPRTMYGHFASLRTKGIKIEPIQKESHKKHVERYIVTDVLGGGRDKLQEKS